MFIIFLNAPVSATTITIKKTKGNQAVIEMSSELEIGKTYNVETENLTLTTDYTSQFKSRINSISVGADASFLGGNKTQDNYFSFFGKYGWNHISFEFGPVVQTEIYDRGFGINTTYLIGGYFDYNYLENRAPRDLLFGPTSQISLGNRNFESGGSAQLVQAHLGGFLTWYINRSSVALRGEINYQVRKVSSANEENLLTGFSSLIYLMYYY